MIKRYTLRVESVDGSPLRYDRGYRLYGVLMATLRDYAYGAELHNQETTPIAQYITYLGGRGEWIINLLGEAAIEQVSAALEGMETLHLHKPDADVRVVDRQVETLPTLRALVDAATERTAADQFGLIFRSPTSFKSEGAYALFPSVAWIVHSLVGKWNAAWPGAPIEDEDAVEALIRGLRLSSYRLSSSYYPLKGAKIPGFTGEITLTARLPAALTELARSLLFFGRYSGVGIKCALGMGGMELKEGAWRG